MEDYRPFFKSYRKDTSEKARQYLHGLMQGGNRKNMERMVEIVPDSDWQQLQHFISDSPWDRQGLLEQISRDADNLLGDPQNACLNIDECGIPKKGKKSAGVSRQWLGRLGKVDNGQVGVFAALSNGKRSTLINERLFLPEEWADNKERCLKSGIPEKDIIHKTKSTLALEMVSESRQLGMRFGWVGADAGYGLGLDFCISLSDMKEVFMIDCACDQHIYLHNPKPSIPPKKKGGRGRKPVRYKTEMVPIKANDWAQSKFPKEWKKIVVREGSKGKVIYEYIRRRVWLWQEGSNRAFQWWLIIRRDPETKKDYKYTLSNASKDTSIERLAFMQGQRYWVERCFEDAKSECGMADYQVRKWRGWHSHMILVMLSMLFMHKEKIHNEDEFPLLSSADIEDLLSHFLPRRDTTVEVVIAHLEKRHSQRQKATDSARRVQEENLLSSV